MSVRVAQPPCARAEEQEEYVEGVCCQLRLNGVVGNSLGRGMRIGQVKFTALFGPYADGSNRPFTKTAAGRKIDSLPEGTKGALYMLFASLTAKVVTTICALVGAVALLGTFFVTLTGGSPFVEFGLALVFFAMFLVGSYWWMIFGPGRVL